VVVIATVLVTVTFQAVRAEDAAVLLTRAQALFQPLPQEMDTAALPTSPARVALGRMLFFDPRWTVEGNVSCATCHQPALYGTDALARSIGAQHRTHPRHGPHLVELSQGIAGAGEIDAGLFAGLPDRGGREVFSGLRAKQCVYDVTRGHARPYTTWGS